jgi:hypothetical protein
MIVVPINQLTTKENLNELVNIGVDRFYMGYMPREWYRKYGWEISSNKRCFPVIPHIIDSDKAKELISFIHSKKKKVFLALNELYYSRQQYPLLLKIIDLFENLNIDAYIVSDLALILEMKKKRVAGRIHLSSCAGLYNLSALSFYRKLGVKHFILPQELSSNEIVNFLKNTPEQISFEVLLIGELCKFNNAFCFTSHGFNRENFCLTKFKKYIIHKDNRSKSHLSPNLQDSDPWCNLCIIPDLLKFKERITFKLPFRESYSSTHGIEIISLARKISDLLDRKNITLKQCREILGQACQKSACAYRKL